MKNTILIALAIMIFASCKKHTTTPATNTTAPPSNTDAYYLSYLDGTNKTTTWDNGTIQFGITSYTTNANMEFGTYLPDPSFGSNSGWLYLALPLDSSNMHKLVLNTNYKIHYYNASYTQSIPDSTLGCLSFMMNTANGTDSTVNQTQTTTYYNKITSVTYIGRVYDTYNQIMSPQYVIKGTFNALVKNNVSNTTRVFSNGKYSFLVGVRAN